MKLIKILILFLTSSVLVVLSLVFLPLALIGIVGTKLLTTVSKAIEDISREMEKLNK